MAGVAPCSWWVTSGRGKCSRPLGMARSRGGSFPCQPKGGRQSCRALGVRSPTALGSEGATPALYSGPVTDMSGPSVPAVSGVGRSSDPSWGLRPEPQPPRRVPLCWKGPQGRPHRPWAMGAARRGSRGAFTFTLVSVVDEGGSATRIDFSAHDHTSLPVASPGTCVH